MEVRNKADAYDGYTDMSMIKYQYKYDQKMRTIKLKPVLNGATIGYICFFLFGGVMGAVLMRYGSYGIWIGSFLIINTLFFPAFILYGFRQKEHFVITRQGIKVLQGNKVIRQLLWYECAFIGIAKSSLWHSSVGLVFSKHPVLRDENGEIPRNYAWSEEETIGIEPQWNTLTEAQQQQILSFCGGMKG